MGTKVQKDFALQAGVHYKNEMLMNIYTFTIIFYVETNCPEEQSIAMDRIKHLLFDCLEHSIFVYDKETDVIEKYLAAGLKVCTLPNVPYDQVVMTGLFCKLNAITEGKFVIEEIILSSKMSDGVKFFGNSDSIDDCFNSNGWYHESNTNLSDYKRKSTKNGKIVKLIVSNNDWVDSLRWDNIDSQKHISEINFTKEK